MPNEEPFKDMESTEPSELLKMLSKSSNSESEFYIKGTEITLNTFLSNRFKTIRSENLFYVKINGNLIS